MPPPAPGSAHGRATERSAGKDTTTGHWEMMGIRLDEPFPLYPDGFPPDVIEAVEQEIGRKVLGNRARVGHGDHRRARRGAPADRAADRLHVGRLRLPDRDPQVGRRPLPTLYEWSRIARRLLTGPHTVGSRHRPAVRRGSRGPSSGAPSGATSPSRHRARRCSTGCRTRASRSSASGRSRTSSPARGSRRRGTRTRTTTGWTSRSSTCADPGLRSSSRTSWTSTPSTGTATTRPGYAACIEAFDRRAPGADRRLGRGRDGDHGGPRMRPDDAADRPFPRADASPGRRARGRSLRPRDEGSFADLGQTVAELLGRRRRGTRGESFVDLLGIEGSS